MLNSLNTIKKFVRNPTEEGMIWKAFTRRIETKMKIERWTQQPNSSKKLFKASATSNVPKTSQLRILNHLETCTKLIARTIFKTNHFIKLKWMWISRKSYSRNSGGQLSFVDIEYRKITLQTYLKNIQTKNHLPTILSTLLIQFMNTYLN